MLSKLYSNRCFCTAIQSPRPWLFVGLGNPGDKFKGTRHNFSANPFSEKACQLLSDSNFFFLHFQNRIHDLGKLMKNSIVDVSGIVDGVPVLLAKPQTYMNLSGESSGPLAAYYKLPLNRVVVFHDDMDLPCGVLRLQPKGGHGSHNGMKSVIYHFRGNREFARLRIGIGKPPGQMDPKAFLLQKFNATAQQRIDVGLKEGVDALKKLVTKGVEEAGRGFNTDQKYKHIKIADIIMAKHLCNFELVNMGKMVEGGMKKGPWTHEEDEILSSYIKREGGGRWRTLPKKAGLRRCGKSCRLRWMNYLRPSVKRGGISPEEEDLIIRLHRLLGNRWSLIAGRIPGRTDNEIKNYWNTHLSKKLASQGIDPRTHKPLPCSLDINRNFVSLSSIEQPEAVLPYPNEKIANPNSNKEEDEEDDILSYDVDDAFLDSLINEEMCNEQTLSVQSNHNDEEERT
ncbi:hypothetical protein LXL04_004252 [Taraxacum kok-saghyz]